MTETEEDTNLRKEVWGGYVPIRFNLANDEIGVPQQPPSFYALCPRNSYFPLAIGHQLQEHFGTYMIANTGNQEIWFDNNGEVLKWHFPIGVLFDLYANPEVLPWNVTVHFRHFPSNILVRISGEDSVRSHFFNVLKEANCIKYGDCKNVNQLPVADSNQLWQSLKSYNFGQFSPIYDQLYKKENSSKHIPVRILTKSLFVQESLEENDSNGKPRILEEAVGEMVGKYLEWQKGSYSYLIQGISLPRSTSLSQAHHFFSHPDSFLYIVLHQNPS